MENIKISMDNALRKLNIADHMLISTYPVVKDPKILLTVLDNLFLSITNAMAALLYYEEFHKRISSFTNNFETKFNLLKLEMAEKYNITHEDLKLILEIKNKVQAHKNCAVEFKRKDSFVICSDHYSTEVVSLKDIKEYYSKAKIFINQIEGIVKSKNA